jgi:hypothetical protein
MYVLLNGIFFVNIMWNVVLLECNRMLVQIVSKILRDHSSKRNRCL